MKTTAILEQLDALAEAANPRPKAPKWRGEFDDLPQSEKFRVSADFAEMLAKRAKSAKKEVDLLFNDMLLALNTTDDSAFDEMNRGLAAMTNSLQGIVGETNRLVRVFRNEQNRTVSNASQRGAPWS